MMNETRISESEAGYLELPGATKDGDCNVVEVQGGISKGRGCCNSFKWASEDVEGFKCGECKYLEGAEESEGGEYGENKPLGKKEAGRMSFEDVLNSPRPGKGSKTSRLAE
jgi:hypothetical protein